MNTDVPNPNNPSRPLRVIIHPAPGTVLANAEPDTCAIRIPVARVPVDELLEEPAPGAAPPAAASSPFRAPSGKSASKEIAAMVETLATLLREFPASSITVDMASLPDDCGVLKQMITELLRALRAERRDRQEIQQRLDALPRPRPKPPNPDQPSLFAEADVPPLSTPPTPAPVDDEPANRRGQSKPHGRRRPSRVLRRVAKRYELTAVERLCPECGQDRQQIGVETTEQYDYKPAEVFVIEHQQVKYACKCCQGQVAMAEKPPQPIEIGLPGPGLLAQIVAVKYLEHIPLHRSEQRFSRLGVDLPRSTMCDWMASCAELLTPLHLLLVQHVLKSKVLHTDDTTVPVRDEKRSSHRYGRLWNGLSSAERLRLRQEKSVPLLKSLHQWLLAQKTQVLPKSPIATAINYVLNQWEALTRYTTDGDLDIDNNISERTLKLIGMGRGNWLFLGSDNGGRTAAVLFSFTATCKLLGIDSFAYLRDVFERLPTQPVERLDELLPHRWKAARTARAADDSPSPV